MPRDGRSVIEAAGCVVWRQVRDGAVEVLLVHRPPPHDDWSLPKGKLHPGETHVRAASREVYEETGVRGELGRPLGEVRYELPSGDHKHVRYWSMEADHIEEREPDDEVDALRWVSLGSAPSALSWQSDRTVLAAFAGLHAGGAQMDES